MFLFLRHIDEHHRLTKMFEAIKDSLVEWNRPVQNVLQVSIWCIKLGLNKFYSLSISRKFWSR